MKKIFLVCLVLLCGVTAMGREPKDDPQEVAAEAVAETGATKPAKVKKGWNFGPLPAIGYNSDLGFRLGAMCDIYNTMATGAFSPNTSTSSTWSGRNSRKVPGYITFSMIPNI